MIQDLKQQQYRGVKCVRCRQLIPIPRLVATVEAELRREETTILRDLKCRVFNLRCPACRKERSYMIGEILELEAEPAIGTPRAEPNSVRSQLLGERAKASNA